MVKAILMSTLELYAMEYLLEQSLAQEPDGFIRQDLLEKIQVAIQEHEDNLRGAL